MEEREIYHPCRGRDEREGEKRVGEREAKKEAPYSSSSSSSKRGGAKNRGRGGKTFFHVSSETLFSWKKSKVQKKGVGANTFNRPSASVELTEGFVFWSALLLVPNGLKEDGWALVDKGDWRQTDWVRYSTIVYDGNDFSIFAIEFFQ